MDLFTVRERQRRSFAGKIAQLSTDHSASAAGVEKRFKNQLATLPRQSQRTRRLAHAPRRQRNHGDTPQYCDPRAVNLVHCRPAPTHVIVIHARQIIVHQRVRVNHFGSAGEERSVFATASRLVGKQHKERTESLSRALQAVSNGVRHLTRNIGEIACANLIEPTFDVLSIRVEPDDHLSRDPSPEARTRHPTSRAACVPWSLPYRARRKRREEAPRLPRTASATRRGPPALPRGPR